MRFALVNNKEVEAKSGLMGICKGCSQKVIPKCGEQRIPHWAHYNNKMCDSWWEPETEWHRKWKSNFPEGWQEKFLIDQKTGEKHIADIRTNTGFVIEFQHSYINPEERKSRELFYKNMVWVADGSRLKRDYPRFMNGKDDFKIIRKGIFRVDNPEEFLPSSWLSSLVPVIFDFQNCNLPEHINSQDLLYCLFPVKVDNSAVIAEITANAFVNNVISGAWVKRTMQFINDLNQVKKERQEYVLRMKNLQASLLFQKFMGRNNNQIRRRRL